MTQDTKVKIWAIAISAATSMLVMIVSFTLQASKDDSRGLDQKLEQKVDKVEFKDECKRTDERIKRIENTYDLLVEIRNNQAQQKTDIEWIKKALDKKQK